MALLARGSSAQMSHFKEASNEGEEINELVLKQQQQQQSIKENIKVRPLHIRMLNSKLQSPSDALSPFSQKIVSERSSALKNLKPKSLTDTFLNSSPAVVSKSSSRLGLANEESSEESSNEFSQVEHLDLLHHEEETDAVAKVSLPKEEPEC